MTDSEKIGAYIRKLVAKSRRNVVMQCRLCANVSHRPWTLVLALLLILVLGWAVTCVSIPFPSGNVHPMLTVFWNVTVKLGVTLTAFLLVLTMLTTAPPRAMEYEAIFTAIDFTDCYGNPPALISKKKEKSSKVIQMTFYCSGISLKQWQERQGDIQDALNVTYVEAPQYAYNKRYYIMLTVVPGVGGPRKGSLYDDEL